MAFSPYVRRLRLAAALRKLREDRNLTADQAAKIIYQSRGKLSKLETARTRPDAFEIMEMLDRLEVTGEEREKIIELARTAAKKCYWEQYSNVMGSRQRLYADLEFGAATIRCFDTLRPHGIMQIPEYITELVRLDKGLGNVTYSPKRMAEARLHRQRHALRPDGPYFDQVLDECAFHRLDIPAEVMGAQLRHMVELLKSHERITLRLLPPTARVPGCLLPKGPFTLFTFSDPEDPDVVVIDTFTSEVVLTEADEVAKYTRLYNKLRKAALSPEESIVALDEMAHRYSKN